MAAYCVFYVRSLWLGETNVMLSSAGQSALLLSSNLMGGEEIGVYVGRVASDKLETVRKHLVEGDIFSVSTRRAVRPESLGTTFGLQQESEAEPRLKSFLRDEMTPALFRAERDILPLIDELRKQPAYVLAGAGRWTSRNVRPGAELGFEVKLRNSGPNAVRLTNPSRGKDGVLPLTFQMSRDGASRASNADETLSVALAPDNLVLERGQRPDDAERLELAPGAEMRIRLRKKIYASPGQYNGVVRFATSGEENEIEVMRDFLLIPLGVLTLET